MHDVLDDTAGVEPGFHPLASVAVGVVEVNERELRVVVIQGVRLAVECYKVEAGSSRTHAVFLRLLKQQPGPQLVVGTQHGAGTHTFKHLKEGTLIVLGVGRIAKMALGVIK